MVKRLIHRLRRWQALDAVLLRLVGVITPWRFARATFGTGMLSSIAAMPAPVETPRAAPPPIAPGVIETRFMRLHAENRFEEMWEMLADDAQRAWGGRHNFIRDMPRLDQWMEILEMEVVSTSILPSWTDTRHQRAYNNVARLVMRYRVRQQWRDWTFERHVHLISEGGTWRTLCYPTRGAAGR